MSVLKDSKVTPSRVRGIFRYLLPTKRQREKKEILARILSPNELVKDKTEPRPMFNASLRESIKCKLLVEENEEIVINPELPEEARNPQVGDQLLPNTLAELFFASDNPDEEDFGLVCAWYLAQNIYEAPGTWEDVEKQVSNQKVGNLLKMSSDALYSQMDDWMCYMGLAWGHALGGKRVSVPDPTAYLRRNLKYLFKNQRGDKILLREFIERLAKKCPLFETGKFRDTIEGYVGRRLPNYLSTSTAFALFRLQDDGYVQLKRESDADLFILPKGSTEERISHIIWTRLEV